MRYRETKDMRSMNTWTSSQFQRTCQTKAAPGRSRNQDLNRALTTRPSTRLLSTSKWGSFKICWRIGSRGRITWSIRTPIWFSRWTSWEMVQPKSLRHRSLSRMVSANSIPCCAFSRGPEVDIRARKRGDAGFRPSREQSPASKIWLGEVMVFKKILLISSHLLSQTDFDREDLQQQPLETIKETQDLQKFKNSKASKIRICSTWKVHSSLRK